MIFRATRGKAFTYFQDIQPDEIGLTDYTGAQNTQLRTVYVVVFQEGQHIRGKIQKICDSFLGRSVEIPSVVRKAELL